MFSTFILPFKVGKIGKTVWQNHALKFYTMYPYVVAIYHPFIQNRSTNTSHCSINKSQNSCIKVHLFQLLHLHNSVGPGLCVSKDRKVFCMHKATMWSKLFLSQQALVSESCKYSSSMRMSFFFIEKTVKCCHISLGILLRQPRYVNDVFYFLIEQYFIDTLETILKLFQGF